MPRTLSAVSSRLLPSQPFLLMTAAKPSARNELRGASSGGGAWLPGIARCSIMVLVPANVMVCPNGSPSPRVPKVGKLPVLIRSDLPEAVIKADRQCHKESAGLQRSGPGCGANSACQCQQAAATCLQSSRSALKAWWVQIIPGGTQPGPQLHGNAVKIQFGILEL